MVEVVKDRVLIIGATGYIGRWLVKASLAAGHPTTVLYRPENVSDVEKCQLFMGFKMAGATLLQGSLDDHAGLLSVLRQVDVVVSTIAGDHVLKQLKLVEAIKEVGTIKRYIPSEFGMDVDRMEHAIPPGDHLFAEKRMVRRAIEKANISHTYISANCLAGVFLAGLAQLGTFMPPRDHINIYGDGTAKCIWVEEGDVAACAIIAATDPRARNKVLYIRPRVNILSQMEVVEIWEKLIGKELQKTFLSKDEWLLTLGIATPFEQVAVAHLYQIYYLGDLDFEVEGTHGVDSNVLYPDHRYVTAEEYLKRFA